jgi:hypothetical protein
VGSLGAAPSAAAGGVVFVGASWRALSLDAEGRADLPATASSPDVAGVRVGSRLLTGSLVPCAHLGAAFGCGVASLGAISATSEGAVVPRDDSGTWAAAGARVGAGFDVWRALRWQAYGEVLWTLSRRTLTVDGTQVYEFLPLSADLGTSLAWRFP